MFRVWRLARVLISSMQGRVELYETRVVDLNNNPVDFSGERHSNNSTLWSVPRLYYPYFCVADAILQARNDTYIQNWHIPSVGGHIALRGHDHFHR